MLSISIITRNSEKILPKCLASVQTLSDDIVVIVDDRTTDHTAALARKLRARVYIHKFINYSMQKNFAASKAKHDWVLSLDDDETISHQLAQEISRVLPTTSYDAFRIPRLNYIFGKPIHHANWGPQDDTHIWLFKKSKSTWHNGVHEEVQVAGKVGDLQGYKLHNNYSSVEQFIEKMNTYTSLETTPTNPLYDFLRRYIWHLGFLDGWHGLFLSYLMVIYYLSSGVKLWQRSQ